MSDSVTPTTAAGAPSFTTAEKIAQRAAALVSGDRQKTHGDKLANHRNIAELWSAYWCIRSSDAPADKFTPEDVAHMMVLLKIARTQLGAFNPDDWIDMCGYAAVAGELAERAL